jgi:hypothetical protein
VAKLRLFQDTDTVPDIRNPTWDSEALLLALTGSEELTREPDGSSSEVKETIIALHAQELIEDTQLPELVLKTPESSSMRLLDGNTMIPMVAELELFPEIDIALDTRNPTWELEASLHA